MHAISWICVFSRLTTSYCAVNSCIFMPSSVAVSLECISSACRANPLSARPLQLISSDMRSSSMTESIRAIPAAVFSISRRPCSASSFPCCSMEFVLEFSSTFSMLALRIVIFSSSTSPILASKTATCWRSSSIRRAIFSRPLYIIAIATPELPKTRLESSRADLASVLSKTCSLAASSLPSGAALRNGHVFSC